MIPKNVSQYLESQKIAHSMHQAKDNKSFTLSDIEEGKFDTAMKYIKRRYRKFEGLWVPKEHQDTLTKNY